MSEISLQLQEIRDYIEAHKEAFIQASRQIYGFAELSYEEFQSMEVLTELLKTYGFTVETGLAEMPTCFTGKWGQGRPVIGFLGEFDALDTLSQEGGNPVKTPIVPGGPGHGCGHSLLGVGALAAAAAVKEYFTANHLSGTVIYYGCPAEEGAGAKQFMARDGLFDECDFVYTWHPDSTNDVGNIHSNAIMGANFEFFGKTAHAGGNPWMGRSALDAAELMSVGCNYLREHIRDGERIHYAYADAGGTAPNVVQDYARVKYEVRAPRVKEMKQLFDRVVKVAEGAALMTETRVQTTLTMAFSDFENNPVLARFATEALLEAGAPDFDEADIALAKAFLSSYDEETQASIREQLIADFGREAVEGTGEDGSTGDGSAEAGAAGLWERPLHLDVLPYDPDKTEFGGGSTDVGDVSYAVPTCEVHTATCCLGNIGHTWQMAGQACSSIGFKGMLRAAEVMALAAVRLGRDDEAIQEAAKLTKERSGGAYVCPLPPEVKPPVGTY